MPKMPLGVVLSARGDLQGRLQRVRDAGLPTIQLVSPPASDLAEPRRGELVGIILRSGVRVTSVAAVYAGESYADVAAVRATVGLLPRETRTARIEHTKRCGDFAHVIDAPNLSSHIGYIPEDRRDADYDGVVSAVQEICEHLAASKQSFCLETGQETAALLRDFIADVGRPNLHVNFDPANMIMYGTGDPIEALGVLAPWVRGVHCKDGEWPKSAGQLGEEKRLGDGQVGLERFLAKLKEVGYEGPLTIEREIGGEQQMLDFLAAKKLLEQIKAKLGIG